MDRKTLKAAFPATVPVLMGYLAIGMAFGLMLGHSDEHDHIRRLWAVFGGFPVGYGGDSRPDGLSDSDGQFPASGLWPVHAGEISGHGPPEALYDFFPDG